MRVISAPRPHKVGFKVVGASSGLVVPSFGFLICGFSGDNPATLRTTGGVDYVVSMLNTAPDGEPWEQADASQQPSLAARGNQGRKVLVFPSEGHRGLVSSVNNPMSAPYWTEFYLVKVAEFATYSTAFMDWRKGNITSFSSVGPYNFSSHINNVGSGNYSVTIPLDAWLLVATYERSGTFYARVNGVPYTASGNTQPIASGINDLVLGRSTYFGSLPPDKGGWDFVGEYACALGYAGSLTDEQILATEQAIKDYYSDLISF